MLHSLPCFVESVLINYWFMNIFYSLPCWCICFNILSPGIKSLPLLSMNNISNVIFPLEYLFYMRIVPFSCFFSKFNLSWLIESVFRRWKNSFVLQSLCNTSISLPIQKHIKNSNYIVRYLFINQKLSWTICSPVISIWWRSLAEAALCPNTMLSGLYFLWKVFGIIFVHNILKRYG